jgi:RNA polymerase sigma factor (sigma-70 family)
VYRITINTCLMWVRKEKRSAEIQQRVLPPEPATEPDESKERIEKLYQAIGQLGEVDRLIIMLVLDELEYDEVARIVGITENNVRVKVHRIKQRLKVMMNYGRGT